MRYGEPRDISGVPEWGAPCYVFDLNTGKLENNAERVYWLGYDDTTPTKGHRLWSKSKHKNLILDEPRVRKPSQYVRDIRSGVFMQDNRPSQPLLPRGLQVPPEQPPADVTRTAFANAQQLYGYIDFAHAAAAQHGDPELLEPASHDEALSRPDADCWLEAEQAERDSLKDKAVYEWVSRDDVRVKGRKTPR
ncbi:hypothetical protein AURDEDRAFT_125388 [Auricularia subglabra TFB-10046 SS5]|nr:hypothetical protein AURDEDRAFT_125388 [Auricularia subglabra TFB-10046 SS5]